VVSLEIDQYAEFVVPPETLWAIVGDPRRLHEWTGATVVDPPTEWAADTSVTVRDGGTRDDSERVWQVISVGQRVVEVHSETACGQLGIGVRVIGAPPGSRVVFVALLEPNGGALRARLRDAPALRRRFDGWAAALRQLVHDPRHGDR
jgi:hypothetical protein